MILLPELPPDLAWWEMPTVYAGDGVMACAGESIFPIYGAHDGSPTCEMMAYIVPADYRKLGRLELRAVVIEIRGANQAEIDAATAAALNKRGNNAAQG